MLTASTSSILWAQVEFYYVSKNDVCARHKVHITSKFRTFIWNIWITHLTKWKNIIFLLILLNNETWAQADETTKQGWTRRNCHHTLWTIAAFQFNKCTPTEQSWSNRPKRAKTKFVLQIEIIAFSYQILYKSYTNTIVLTGPSYSLNTERLIKSHA
jgi:hypothetical protein